MFALQQAGRHGAAAHTGRAANSTLVFGEIGGGGYSGYVHKSVLARVVTRHPFAHRGHIYRHIHITGALLGRQRAG